jgi:GNAT superfamily N-acetyltransferase
VEVRDFDDADAPAVVSLLRGARPANLWSVAAFRHFQRTLPERARFARWLAEEDGEVVGWGSALLHAHSSEADSGGIHVTVAAARRRAGIGRALYGLALEHMRAVGARRISAVAVDEDGYRFLERRGFRHTHTDRFSRVDPREVDLTDLAALRDRASRNGFVVAPFADCSPAGVHAVDAEASADIPEDTPMTHMPFDEWLSQHWEHPLMTKQGSFAVLHESRPVTIAMLRVDHDGRRAGNDITGTLRAFRGRGLARLAKLSQLEWAAAAGVESVITSNDSTNAAMLAVNARLGYTPFHEERSYARELDG